MSLGLIVKSGRILTAKLLLGDLGITHCAIGEGDDTFTDPTSPPNPDISQTALNRVLKNIFIAFWGTSHASGDCKNHFKNGGHKIRRV